MSFWHSVTNVVKNITQPIIRAPQQAVKSVTNLVRNPTDLKAWGSVALAVNPVTAIPNTAINLNASPSIVRKKDLIAGIGATTLATLGAGTLARTAIAGTALLGSASAPPVNIAEGQSFAPGTDLSGIPGASDLVAPSSDMTLPNIASQGQASIADTLTQGAKNLITSATTGLKTKLSPNVTNASALGTSSNTLIYVIIGATLIGVFAITMGRRK